ncbi:MAG: hypothetical protein HPY45_16960 [Anaerolineae bacterium]|nr:hypothetical protein [Anaerolineae bacterium]
MRAPFLVKLSAILLTMSVFVFGLWVPRPALAQADNPAPPEQPVKLIFIHHSTGENWLRDGYGNLGRTLGQNNYFVSDTNYGWGPDSIGDRTDIVNWPEWFGAERSDRVLQALYRESGQHSEYTRTLPDPGGENQIVMFKSCFPNSNLDGNPDDPPTPGSYDYTVGSAKYIYNSLLEYFITRPDKMFVVITAPPVSDPTFAKNARAFNNWLMTEWLAGYQGNNVFVFDFYNVLTGTDNHHRWKDGQVEYINNAGGNTLVYPSEDDHPSAAGSQKATDEFVPLLNVFYHRWKSGAPVVLPAPPMPAQDQNAPPPAEQPAEGGAVSAVSGVIDDFEAGGSLESYHDEQGSSIECVSDGTYARSGKSSLRIRYNVKAGGWAGCGPFYGSPQDWSAARGLALWMRSEQAGQGSMLGLQIGTPEGTAPFEFYVELPPESASEWAQVFIPWESFNRAPWADNSGPMQFNAAQVMGYSFNFSDEAPQEGNFWVDDISLAEGEGEAPAAQPTLAPPPAAAEEQPPQPEQEQPQPEGRSRRLPCASAALPLAVVALALRRVKHSNA